MNILPRGVCVCVCVYKAIFCRLHIKDLAINRSRSIQKEGAYNFSGNIEKYKVEVADSHLCQCIVGTYSLANSLLQMM